MRSTPTRGRRNTRRWSSASGQRLGLTSLRYQNLDDLVEAIGLPKEKLCTYCWDGTSSRPWSKPSDADADEDHVRRANAVPPSVVAPTGKICGSEPVLTRNSVVLVILDFFGCSFVASPQHPRTVILPLLYSLAATVQNPYVERSAPSTAAKYLDHMVVLNEQHLRRIIASYLRYYHSVRTDVSLEKDAPEDGGFGRRRRQGRRPAPSRRPSSPGSGRLKPNGLVPGPTLFATLRADGV